MPTPSDCQRCNGTGVYNGTRRDGTTYQGACFACQGGGPRYRRSYGTHRSYEAAPTAGLGPRLVAAPAPQAAPAAPFVRVTRPGPQWTARQQANLDAFAVAQPMAWVWLVNNAPTSDFAASLQNGIARYGNLTPRQLACVMRNVGDAVPVAPVAPALPSDSAIGFIDPIPAAGVIAPELDRLRDAAESIVDRAVDPARDPAFVAMAQRQWAREANDPTMVQRAPAAVEPVIVNLDRVRTAMESARASGLRKVRLTFGDVTMKLSGNSFRGGVGMILCYHFGGYRGYVDAQNVFHSRLSIDPATLDAFRAVGVDPRAAAATHGHETGNCACCRRLLTDPPSVMAGIGPVCIRRFGWSF